MADLHLHTLYSDGTASIRDLLDWVEERTSLDLIAIADHDRVDGALRARDQHAARRYSFELVVGEEVTTLSGHIIALFVEEPIPAYRSAAATVERIHAQHGLAVAAHPLGLAQSIGSRALRRLQADPRPDRRLDAIELVNPRLSGRARQAERARLAERLALPGIGSSDAHVLDGVGSAWTWFAGTSAAAFRAALANGAVEAAGTHWTLRRNVAIYGRQLVARGRHLRHTLRPTGEWR